MKPDKRKYNPEDFNWPSWKIRGFNCFTIISLVFAFGIFLIGPTNYKDSWKLRIVLIVAALLIPQLTLTSVWIAKICLVIRRRTSCYPFLYNSFQETCSRLLEVEQAFVSQVLQALTDMGYPQFNIGRVTYQNERLYISLMRQATFTLNEGDAITVIDRNDLRYMGQFEVTEVREQDYYAVGTRHIDAVWLGFVKQIGEIQMTPNLLACYKRTGGQDG